MNIGSMVRSISNAAGKAVDMMYGQRHNVLINSIQPTANNSRMYEVRGEVFATGSSEKEERAMVCRLPWDVYIDDGVGRAFGSAYVRGKTTEELIQHAFHALVRREQQREQQHAEFELLASHPYEYLFSTRAVVKISLMLGWHRVRLLLFEDA